MNKKTSSDIAEVKKKKDSAGGCPAPAWRLKAHRLGTDLRRDYDLYLMFIPVFFIAYILMRYGPMYGITIAFKDFSLSKGVFGSPWVGLKHFRRLFRSQDFLLIVRNTLMLNVLGLIFSFPFPIVLALMLNEVMHKRFKKVCQSLLYVPHFISWVVLGGIVIDLLSPSSGVVNASLKAFGGEPIFFMANNKWWVFWYVVSGIWKEAGWGTIIYLAAITNIDPALYESAELDGAGRLKKIWYITLPSIKGTISTLLIMNMGKFMMIGFEQVYMLQNPSVRRVSEVISTYVYSVGLQQAQYSYTTALSLFQSVIGLIMIVLTNKICKSLGESGLW